MSERKYLPTLADLIDRLSILLLKQVYGGGDRWDEHRKEAELVEQDIHSMLFRTTDNSESRFVRAVLILMLANHVIWKNEAAIRGGAVGVPLYSSDRLGDMLRFTHSINGVRSRAKNVIARCVGEREDRKVDCLAADLPPEFGQWDLFS